MKVSITEVSPRDGLQSIAVPVSTADKIELARRAAAAGIKRIEATSFVSPRAIPQMSDAEDVLTGLASLEDVTLEALVPNLRGAERAALTPVHDWVCFISATESHSEANANCSVDKALARIERVVALAQDCGRTPVAAIACSFGCPFEGVTSLEQTINLVKILGAMGIQRIKFGDTIGTATPRQIAVLAEKLTEENLEVDPVLHLHNTRGLSLANVFAGLQAGFTSFESSIGGTGGCPFAPGASGNVATEDLIHFLHAEGHETGVDLAQVIGAGKWLEERLGHSLPAHLLRVGPIGTIVSLDSVKRAKG